MPLLSDDEQDSLVQLLLSMTAQDGIFWRRESNEYRDIFAASWRGLRIRATDGWVDFSTAVHGYEDEGVIVMTIHGSAHASVAALIDAVRDQIEQRRFRAVEGLHDNLRALLT